MKTFRGYVSRESAGILADDPEAAPDTGGDCGASARVAGLLPDLSPAGAGKGRAGIGQDMEDPTAPRTDWGHVPDCPELAPAPRADARSLGSRLSFLFSWRVVVAALVVNALLVAFFAGMMRLDSRSLPPQVYYIFLADRPDGEKPADTQAAPERGEACEEPAAPAAPAPGK